MEITKVRQLTASSGILIYPVIPLTYRFLNHPSSKLRRIGRPRTTLRGIYIISEITPILSFVNHDSGIPSSRRSALGPPLRLQSRVAKLLETLGGSRGWGDSDSPFRRFRQRPGELIAPAQLRILRRRRQLEGGHDRTNTR